VRGLIGRHAEGNSKFLDRRGDLEMIRFGHWIESSRAVRFARSASVNTRNANPGFLFQPSNKLVIPRRSPVADNEGSAVLLVPHTSYPSNATAAIQWITDAR
jgi:hypothetical protein